MIITLKRMQGRPSELSDFKKGFKCFSLSDAKDRLWHMGRTAPPEGEPGHKVAYEVTDAEGTPWSHLYGSFTINRPNDPFQNPADLQGIIDHDWGWMPH